MERSIAQTACKVVEKVLEAIEAIGFSRIGETTDAILGVLKEGTLELVSTGIREMDEAVLLAKKERRVNGLTVKARKVPRTVTTSCGELTYYRTYYQLKDGSKAYLVDQLIGIEPYERVTKELCARLLQRSAQESLQRAAESLGNPVTKQTVDNRLLSMKQVGTEIERKEETPKELHVFADEDHVHVRKLNHSVIVPLVTLTEGIDTSNPKRHRTIHPVYFQGYGMENESFIDNVTAAIYRRYDMDQVERICIHADGGQWIRKFGSILPNAVFIMDGYHLEKHLKQLFRLPGAGNYGGVIRKAVRNDDFDSFVRYCSKISEKLEGKDLGTLDELVNYFQNNWESIVERERKEHCGSCTEALVSHVLSKRLSRDPLGWTEEGLAKMSMLRVYTQNGGTVKASDIRVSRSKEQRKQDLTSLENGLEIYNRYAEEQVRSAFGKAHDWSIFEPKRVSFGKVTGTTVLLNACARLRDLDSLS